MGTEKRKLVTRRRRRPPPPLPSPSSSSNSHVSLPPSQKRNAGGPHGSALATDRRAGGTGRHRHRARRHAVRPPGSEFMFFFLSFFKVLAREIVERQKRNRKKNSLVDFKKKTGRLRPGQERPHGRPGPVHVPRRPLREREIEMDHPKAPHLFLSFYFYKIKVFFQKKKNFFYHEKEERRQQQEGRQRRRARASPAAPQ